MGYEFELEIRDHGIGDGYYCDNDEAEIKAVVSMETDEYPVAVGPMTRWEKYPYIESVKFTVNLFPKVDLAAIPPVQAKRIRLMNKLYAARLEYEFETNPKFRKHVAALVDEKREDMAA